MAIITGETITDEQITLLREQALADRDPDLAATCHQALPGSSYWHCIADWGETRPVTDTMRREARAECARILNARFVAGVGR